MVKSENVSKFSSSHLSSIARGGLTSGVGEVFSITLSSVTGFVLGHVLGADGLGRLFLAVTAGKIVATVARFGLDIGALRFVSAYLGQKAASRLRGFLSFSFPVVLGGGIVWGFLSPIVLRFLRSTGVGQELTIAATIALVCLVPSFAIQGLILKTIQGFKAITKQVVLEQIILPSSRLLLIVVTGVLGLGWVGALSSYLASSLLVVIVGGIVLIRLVQSRVPESETELRVQEWVIFSFPVFADALLSVSIGGSPEILLLGRYALPADVGLFGAAIKISPLIIIPLLASNRVLAPILSEFIAQRKQEETAKVFKTVTRWVFVIAWPACLALFLWGADILRFFGPEFVVAEDALKILSVGWLVNAATGAVGYLLLMAGHSWLSMFNSVLVFCLDLTLGMWLIPRYALIGAAISCSASLAIINLFRLAQVWSIFRIHPYRNDYLQIIFAGIVAFGLVFVAATVLDGVFWVIWAFLYVLVYGVIVFKVGLVEEDRFLLNKVSARLRSGVGGG